MKYSNYIVFILTLSSTLIFSDPLLVVVLMVKNEEPVMATTLQPLIDAGIQDYLIYDTGSTDHTVQVTREIFQKNNILNFVIEQGEFIDFATSRNYALELAERHFPNAVFMLMLDAEWILHHGDDLLRFCMQHKNDSAVLYSIQVKGFNVDFSHARLMRCKSNIAFIGKVHEVPNVPAQVRVPHHIYFELSSTYYGQEKSAARWSRDRDILLEEVKKYPNDTRLILNLGQTYFCLSDYENAIIWYEKRAAMDGWDEEKYLALFILAQAYQSAGNTDKMINFYLKAFAFRPCRAEPLIRLAEYYYEIGAYRLSYLFAKASLNIPYPHQEILAIEKWLYDFVRYDIVSSTAYMFDDYALGLQATQQALIECPDSAELQNNLAQYRLDVERCKA